MKRIFHTGSPEESRKTGILLGSTLHPGDVVVFTGDLGAGKTTFVGGIASGMGHTDRVTSPTFTIVNEYREPENIPPLFHFDMYRISSSEDLYAIGWDDYLREGGVCAVEWSENVEDAIPEDAIIIDITCGPGDDDRTITIDDRRG